MEHQKDSHASNDQLDVPHISWNVIYQLAV